ncbi:MAG: cation diffusion facilitator family transporter [Proteobacteria bacterium]|nr:cation diffusion facilitator family transporter [Pseudomonadota bacterium]
MVVVRSQDLSTLKRVTWVGAIVNVVLSVLKLVVGYLLRSQTMIADGIHSLSDLISDVAILVGARFWSAPPDADHPYGHARLENLVTAFIGALLCAVAVGIGYDAIGSFMQQETALRAGFWGIIVTAGSLVVKEVLYQWTVYHAKRIHSAVLHANAWHHRSDALSSVPALIAIVLAAINPDWYFIDAIGALVISGMLLVMGGKILLKAFSELIDKGPSPETCAQLASLALQVEGVCDAHAIRARQFGSSLIVDLHIEVDPDMSVRVAHDISEAVQKKLVDDGPNIHEVIVHIEPKGEG